MKEISGVLIQEERGSKRVIRFQLTLLLKWTKTKMNGKVKKYMEFADNMTITEIIVPTYLHLSFSLEQILLLMYFIYNVIFFYK